MNPQEPNNLPLSVDIKPAETRDRIVPVICGLVFLSVGLFCSWFLLIQPLSICSRSKQWPLVDATVEESRVASHLSHSSASHSSSTSYSSVISYRYTYNGTLYRSSRFYPINFSSSDYNSASKLVSQYPIGIDMKVRVNPEDPTYALGSSSFPGGLFALVLLVFGLSLFVFGGSYVIWRSCTAKYILNIKASKGNIIRFFDTEEAARAALEKAKTKITYQF
jgi:hypothetical protein